MAATKPQKHATGDTQRTTPNIVRYADLEPCYDAFIDTRTPGSDQKENFTIIGPGVSENPNQFVHIAEPHGFNIGGARQPPGCTNSQHSHDTVEVFYVHKGTWSFDLGEHGEDASITLRPGDLISIPTKVFRGFKNTGKDIGYLWAVLGQDNPGRVTWAPKVFEMAKDYGLVLLENGSLIDTTKGERIPNGAKVMPVTSPQQVRALQKFNAAQLRECCILSDEKTAVIEDSGRLRRSLVGPSSKLNWDHGFSISEFRLAPGAATDMAAFSGPEVIFVHKGELAIETFDSKDKVGAGDTASIPKGVSRKYRNTGSQDAIFVRVQGA